MKRRQKSFSLIIVVVLNNSELLIIVDLVAKAENVSVFMGSLIKLDFIFLFKPIEDVGAIVFVIIPSNEPFSPERELCIVSFDFQISDFVLIKISWTLLVKFNRPDKVFCLSIAHLNGQFVCLLAWSGLQNNLVWNRWQQMYLFDL